MGTCFEHTAITACPAIVGFLIDQMKTLGHAGCDPSMDADSVRIGRRAATLRHSRTKNAVLRPDIRVNAELAPITPQ